ncbi:MAG: pantoate--beta-alanine ligase [Gemmatimonadota bacterium]|nr:pantoate--beta-alanine ligase [Gemmatimonadota bacterium]
MHTVEPITEVRRLLSEHRQAGGRVVLVPTMGFLHEGHLRLVDEARRHGSLVVMSIFVNPLQFAPSEDLTRYPRDLEGDAAKAASRGVDVLFTPSLAAMYPEDGRAIEVTPRALAGRWEGAARPGHFTGVLTVVAKLFNITQPAVAIFGQKDIQQCMLVQAMVCDLNFPVEIVMTPTVRESDGLAMSSRNSYLLGDDRRRAVTLWNALRAMRRAFEGGERSSTTLERVGRGVLSGEPSILVDYLAIADPARLEPVKEASPGTVIAVAAHVGGTRLIDNVILGAA